MITRKVGNGFRDITGQRFDLLTVVTHKGTSASGQTLWLCRCDCGRTLIMMGANLGRGTKSCGCWKRSLLTKHGMSTRDRTAPEYNSWHSMLQRCGNPNNWRYHRYGGRGISVCARWRDSFSAFFEDMGKKPTLQHSLERIDNNGNYQPDNVRWATVAEQNRNNSQTHVLSFKGKTMCLTDWAIYLGINRATLAKRVRKWSLERALSTPVERRV